MNNERQQSRLLLNADVLDNFYELSKLCKYGPFEEAWLSSFREWIKLTNLRIIYNTFGSSMHPLVVVVALLLSLSQSLSSSLSSRCHYSLAEMRSIEKSRFRSTISGLTCSTILDWIIVGSR